MKEIKRVPVFYETPASSFIPDTFFVKLNRKSFYVIMSDHIFRLTSVKCPPIYLVSDLCKENQGSDHEQVAQKADRSNDDIHDLDDKVTC